MPFPKCRISWACSVVCVRMWSPSCSASIRAPADGRERRQLEEPDRCPAEAGHVPPLGPTGDEAPRRGREAHRVTHWAVGTHSAWHWSIGLPRSCTSAASMVWLVTSPDVSKTFKVPPCARCMVDVAKTQDRRGKSSPVGEPLSAYGTALSILSMRASAFCCKVASSFAKAFL